MYINILLPVYNEEQRIKNGIEKTINYFDSINFYDFQLTIIDNASTDKTELLSLDLEKKYTKVKYLRINEKGVGIAFRYGVQHNTSDIIGYMDIDLSTDITHLYDVISMFKENSDLDIINGSRLNKNSKTMGRKWYRNITSHGLTIVLKLFLGLKASDSICGFKFFRHSVANSLVLEASNENGWFYIIELLLRAERRKYQIKELPVRWQDDYNTTVHVWKLIKNYLINIFKLRKQFKKENIL